MRNVLTVIKHEIVTTVSKPSFWFMAILFPLFIVGINVFSQIVSRQSAERVATQQQEARANTTVYPYVDEAGLINALPEDVPANMLLAYPSREAARAALERGEIQGYTIITGEYLQTGQIIQVMGQFNIMNTPQDQIFRYLLAYNLTGDAQLTAALMGPMQQAERRSVAPPAEEGSRRQGSEALAYLVPFAVMFVFFFLITMGSGFMLQSVSKEKENRTVEVLLVSVNSRQLMLGKIVGLSLVVLLQMLIWMAGGMFALGGVSQLVDAGASFTFPPGFLFFAVLFFLLGFLMYASLMGAVGALAPSAKEAGSFTFIVMIPLIIPVWFNQMVLTQPDGPLSTIFSLIPFTAPISMLTRMAVVDVPVWQIALSLAGLALTTYLMVVLAARFFRADTLLSSAPLKKENVLAALRG